jgi:solute carrier family 50 protein (sugar transporter)
MYSVTQFYFMVSFLILFDTDLLLYQLPLAIMSIVSVAWLVYGLSIGDPYVALSNIAGCVASVGYVVGVLPLIKNRKDLRLVQSVVTGGAAATLGLWTWLVLSSTPLGKSSSVLGLFASSLFIILSGSPLSTIRTVMKDKNSASILGQLTIAQVVNTLLWSVYGLAVRNRFVWGPNVVGFGLGIIQLALKISFPTKKTATSIN